MDALEQARAEIDTVDAQLAALFERRMAAVLQVAEYKRGLKQNNRNETESNPRCALTIKTMSST